MAMNVGSSSSDEPEVMMEINTTPLIDVMLVLLIMLIITIPIQLHSVNLNMPVGTPPPPTEPPQVVTLLNKLEKLGLAVRVRCKPDKRSYGIFLSKAGETLLKQLKEIAAASDREATAALSDAERQQLLQLLHKVYRQNSNATD